MNYIESKKRVLENPIKQRVLPRPKNLRPELTRKLPEPKSDEELPVQEKKRKRELKKVQSPRVTEIHHHHYYYSQVPMYNPYPD